MTVPPESQPSQPTAPRVVVVSPTFNERDNLPILARQLADLKIPNLQLLVVDDNSPDGTGEVADELAATSGDRVAVLHRTEKDGLGRAYVAGISRALADGADVVLQMDADLSHPTEVIPEMLQILARQPDVGVVLGSRYVAGGSAAGEWAWYRRLLSAFANVYVNTILRLHVKDATAGFKAWRAATLRRIDVETIRSNGYAFQVEMNYRTVRNGIRIAETPIHFEERAEGQSKMTLSVQLESALMPWRLLFGRKV
ncbi:polyprenol monophosphomannose synthase [Microlunatus soli]|uniref:Dolichol-phosphate mannosyltransferase n=1 Tax=Microlunatus soli TaxID=630515 RepID=A0A1H1MWQ5_9ACTN|nr:polyprenol monophosphomannose synthase [Microlunatus soli]SDR91206.1 dolichol-phosphate mannosyltransferase [Microlunatus soli]